MKNIKLKGKEYYFYDKWQEVPTDSFVKFNNLHPSINDLEEKIKAVKTKIEKLKVPYEKFHFSNAKASDKQSEKYRKLIEKENDKFDLLDDELNLIEVQAISHFTNAPIDVLLSLDRYGANPIAEVTTIDYFKNRLIDLSNVELPQSELRTFVFQSKTDKEIESLENEYKNTSALFSPNKRRELRKEINDSKNHTYTITDIWEQTTTINKQLQDMANNIIQQMKIGDFTSLPYLVSMLTIEGNIGSEKLQEIKKGGDVKQYVELYMAEFKEILNRRVEVLFGQEKTLSIYQCIQIKNFFLSN